MARPGDIRDADLRARVETAFAAMRAARGAEAVRAVAEAYLRFLELNPAALGETIAMRGRRIPRVMRWPDLGARLVPDSVRAGAPKIEMQRERFSVSEAMTYYQFVLDEIVDFERRGA